MENLKGKCKLLSWEDIHDKSKSLAGMIKKSGFQPDIIIGLARGGWVPARNLCDFLGIKDLISIKMEHWGDTATMDGTAKMKYPVNVDLSGKSVLIVDDCADSGESLHVAKEFVKTLKPRSVKTATLQSFESTPDNRLPDFCTERIPWSWQVYPWNYTEDMISLICKMVDKYEKMHHTEIKPGMDAHFDINIDDDTLQDILEEAERRNKLKKHDDESWKKY